MSEEIFERSLESLNSSSFGSLSWTSPYIPRCEGSASPPVPDVGIGVFSTSEHQPSWTERKLRPISTAVKLVEKTSSESECTEPLNLFLIQFWGLLSSAIFALETGGKGFEKVSWALQTLTVPKPSCETRTEPQLAGTAALSLARGMKALRRVKGREKRVAWGSRQDYQPRVQLPRCC